MKKKDTKPSLALQHLRGLTPWNVKIGHSSFLTMEFGKERIQEFRGKTHKHGEWHLWLQCCAWRIQRDGRILVASGDEREVLVRAINRLKLGSLRKVKVSQTLDLQLMFGGNIDLITFVNNRYRYEQWELFKPNGRVLTAKAGGVLAEEDAGGLPTSR